MLGRVAVGAAGGRGADPLRCFGAARLVGILARGGASPDATDSGSEDSPMCWLASRVADHATPALNAIPSNAPIHNAARRLIVGRRYSAPG